MKAVSVALAAHQQQETTTLSWQLRVESRLGEVIGRTTCDHSLTISGELYEPFDGFTPTAVEGKEDTSVPNMDVQGFLSSLGVSEADIIGGKWDGAACTVFEVNYMDLTMGEMIIAYGNLGQISAGRTQYNSELRGVTQYLQQVVGDVYTSGCTAKFGDDRCKFDVEALRVTGALTAVASRRTFTDTSRAEAADYFTAGVIRFTSGANEDYEMEIAGFVGGIFTLALPMPFNVAVGDTYSVVPGCRKRFEEDCVATWANWVNYRGFPHVPGGDKMLGLGGTEGTNL